MMYRCLKEDLIYFENCVDFTFLSIQAKFTGFEVFIVACFGLCDVYISCIWLCSGMG